MARKRSAPVETPTQQVDSAKQAVLDKAVNDILKRYGDGSIMRLGEAQGMVTEVIPTGSLSLDIALGVGGIPRGRITEIYGPESSGKTTLCLHVVSEAQKVGGTAAFIDMEHALDPVYAARLGVDIDNLLVSQPDTGEQALEIAETLVRSGAVDVVVVDSVAALVPRSEIEGDMGDATMGVQARLMSQALRKLSGAINQTKTSVIFTNQLRQKIGVMFGNPETTTGGQALKFYASLRIDVRRIQSIKLGEEVIGNRTRVKVVKNKVAPPFRTAEFDIMFNEGISKSGDVLDLATKFEVIQKRGAFFSYGDVRIGQGRENAKDYLRSNPDLMGEIETVIRQKAISGEIALPLDMGDGGEDSGGGNEEEA
ncbi:MAG TPA: recombinase RecA [Anaerolineales bacterium]|nr:recombinase RecA [Anaerolineales bacterium]HNN12630.1 recombinase RecA [Anaerolineales bacterium]